MSSKAFVRSSQIFHSGQKEDLGTTLRSVHCLRKSHSLPNLCNTLN